MARRFIATAWFDMARSSRQHRRWLLAAALSFTAVPARADIAPLDACDEAGKSCDNAFEGHRADDPSPGRGEAEESGTCENAQCWSKGSAEPVVVQCLRCIESDSGCSCRAGGLATHGSLAVVMLVLGIGALALSRRRL